MKHEHVGNGWFNLVHCVQSMVDEMNKDQMKTHTRNHELPRPFACHSTIEYIYIQYIHTCAQFINVGNACKCCNIL